MEYITALVLRVFCGGCWGVSLGLSCHSVDGRWLRIIRVRAEKMVYERLF
jgi:hypothetical protein